MGVAAAAAALALRGSPLEAGAAAAAGAALAAAVRALAGESAAALSAAAIAPLLAVASIAEAGSDLTAPCLALAGIGWTAAELARPSPSRAVLAPALLAAILAPPATPLLAIAGVRLAPRPGAPGSRWALAVPLAGALAVALAIGAGAAAHSRLGELWYGAAARPISPLALIALAGGALGPLAALAALAGLAALVRPRPPVARGHLPELAVAACAAGALLADLRAGAIGPLTLGLGALAAGLGAARFAGQIRLPAGQALAGATLGLMLLLPPAWTAVESPGCAGARSNAKRCGG